MRLLFECIKQQGLTQTDVNSGKYDGDWHGMIALAENAAREDYQMVAQAFGGAIPKIKTWADIREQYPDHKEAMDAYHSQEGIKQLASLHKEGQLINIIDLDDFQCTESEYVLKRGIRAITPFAFLKDGIWYERGKMGWWATVTDEKPDWNSTFQELLNGAKDDERITIIDRHI